MKRSRGGGRRKMEVVENKKEGEEVEEEMEVEARVEQ